LFTRRPPLFSAWPLSRTRTSLSSARSWRLSRYGAHETLTTIDTGTCPVTILLTYLRYSAGELQRQVWWGQEEVGRRCHGLQVPGKDQGQGEAHRQGGCTAVDLSIAFYAEHMHVVSLSVSWFWGGTWNSFSSTCGINRIVVFWFLFCSPRPCRDQMMLPCLLYRFMSCVEPELIVRSLHCHGRWFTRSCYHVFMVFYRGCVLDSLTMCCIHVLSAKTGDLHKINPLLQL
jgi:hypothetical protein